MIKSDWKNEMLDEKIKRFQELKEMTLVYKKSGCKYESLNPYRISDTTYREIAKEKYWLSNEDLTRFAVKELEKEIKKIENEVKEKVGKILELEITATYMIVKGTKSKIQIQKIMAGGYNIQKLHTRIKIKELA